MDDRELEKLLESTVEDNPPEAAVINGITPWKQAMNRVIAGLVLTSVTLNFLNLQYILPFVGVLLMLVGFRALRRENLNFTLCFVLTVMRVITFFSDFILNTTIWHNADKVEYLVAAGSYINVLICLLIFLDLRAAFREVQRKADMEEHTGGFTALIIWYIVVLIIAILGGQISWFGLGLLLIAYIRIIRALLKLSRELDDAGYAIKPTASHVRDSVIVGIICAAVAVSCACGYLFFNKYPMDWQEKETVQSEATAAIRENLLSLGFPDYVLDDLAEEEILALAGADLVAVDEHTYSFGDGKRVEKKWVKDRFVYSTYEVRELRMTGIAVHLSGEPGGWWEIYHHFEFVEPVPFYGTEAVKVWDTKRGRSEGWEVWSDIQGRVLYDIDDMTYTAPYYTIRRERYTSSTTLTYGQSYSDVIGTLSFPNEGTRQRGYVHYTVLGRSDHLMTSYLLYTHQKTWFQYPVGTAKEYSMAGWFSVPRSPFETIMEQLMMTPDGTVR